MKFTAVFATVLAAVLAVSAAPAPTPASSQFMGEKAKRMAAGLPPLAPIKFRRAVIPDAAPSPAPVRRQGPSAVPNPY
ncbi:hypothetical protein K435DRAFT_849350 [Dendrothele bispora CBS 962.96]|uniref:Uncharacterized protein n=1 Tax=Dendrothele bispora (strain CBS 962.96) TaxID=1314807 RepID=A0A4S8MTA5_DENBC|nr:hypothetical protein K435DRAFT_849350 [Dendrothele bispora CBS 962.96]